MNSRRVMSATANLVSRHMQPAKFSTAMNVPKYETLSVTVPKEFVYHVELNRPAKLNALNSAMWQYVLPIRKKLKGQSGEYGPPRFTRKPVNDELVRILHFHPIYCSSEFGDCFKELGDNPDCRAIVLSGAGKIFTAGIDLQDAVKIGQMSAEHDDIARKAKVVKLIVKKYQDAITSVEKCEKPVIAAVHGACIGAGVDMTSAADIRYCTSDAWFQIKEVDLGMAADVGTLQRFPKVIGSDSLARELAFTARKFLAEEARQCGFVNRVFDNKETLLAESIAVAEEISKKSPVAVQGTKLSMVYSRDHGVQAGLDHIAMRNEAMLHSEDFLNAAAALMTKGEPPVFSKL